MEETGITQRTIGLMAVINPPEETGKMVWLFLITFFGLGMHSFINDYLKL
jgi:hypothetical protein